MNWPHGDEEEEPVRRFDEEPIIDKMTSDTTKVHLIQRSDTKNDQRRDRQHADENDEHPLNYQAIVKRTMLQILPMLQAYCHHPSRKFSLALSLQCFDARKFYLAPSTI